MTSQDAPCSSNNVLRAWDVCWISCVTSYKLHPSEWYAGHPRVVPQHHHLPHPKSTCRLPPDNLSPLGKDNSGSSASQFKLHKVATYHAFFRSELDGKTEVAGQHTVLSLRRREAQAP